MRRVIATSERVRRIVGLRAEDGLGALHRRPRDQEKRLAALIHCLAPLRAVSNDFRCNSFSVCLRSPCSRMHPSRARWPAARPDHRTGVITAPNEHKQGPLPCCRSRTVQPTELRQQCRGGGGSPCGASQRNAKMRALVVPQEPERHAQAAPPAECEATRAHCRPVRLSSAKHVKRALAATSLGPIESALKLRFRDRPGTLPKLRRQAVDHRGDHVG